PLYKDLLASPWGAAWQRAAAKYRDAYAQALARSLPVIARRGTAGHDPGPADLFAFDPIDHRWLRLTRTGGAVIALVDAPGSSLSAYASFRDVRAGHGVVRTWRVGAVDRASGRAGREVELDDVERLQIGWRSSRTGEPSLEIETTPPHGASPSDWRLDWRRG